jgi:LacI family transcriptional regulator
MSMSNRKSKLPTTADVAHRAGVSTATVSRVISGAANVRGPAREKVEKAIRALKFQPSRAAQNLRARSSKVVGLVISDIQNPFFTSVVRGIEDTLMQSGYSLVLCNSDEDAAKERNYIEVLHAERVAGVVIASTKRINPGLNRLTQTGVPVVGIDRYVSTPEIDTVQVDNVRASRDAVEHLVKLGHRRIGMVSLPTSLPTGQERRQGFIAAMREAGLEVEPRMISVASNPRVDGGQRAMQQLLGVSPKVTAVFTASNLLTIGTLITLREAGVKIGDELSLVAFDDMTWNSLITPPLTSVSQPTYAAQLLLRRIAQPSQPIERLKLAASLVVRESTRSVLSSNSAASPGDGRVAAPINGNHAQRVKGG